MNTSPAPALPALSPEQAGVLAGWGTEALLLLGGPGTGKSTVIARAAAERRKADAAAPLVLA
ncbi:MAG: hypothetical protein WAL91_06100, partial [Propionicimonas sp.]